MSDSTPGENYPYGSIPYEVLMKAARLLHPGPFKLYVVLLVRSAGKGKCWPARKELAASMNVQIGAVSNWRERLIEANLLELRIGDDGLEHYIVKLPGEELRRRQRSQERERVQILADQRAEERAEYFRRKLARRGRGLSP